MEYFREEQNFRGTWVMWLVTGICLLEGSVFGFGFVKQIIFGEPWGDNPMSDTALIITCVATLGFIGLLWLLIASIKLITSVGETELLVHFKPLRKRAIAYGELESVSAVSYRPIMEYGGWGIRSGGKKGWVYNIKGDQGVKLIFREGKPLLIGSQQSSALAQAIQERLDAQR